MSLYTYENLVFVAKGEGTKKKPLEWGLFFLLGSG